MKDLREAITQDTTVEFSVATDSTFLRDYGKKVRDAGGYYDTFTRSYKTTLRTVFIPASSIDLVAEITSKSKYFYGTSFENQSYFVLRNQAWSTSYTGKTAEEALSAFCEEYKESPDCKAFYGEYFTEKLATEEQANYDYKEVRRLLEYYTTKLATITDPAVVKHYHEELDTERLYERKLYFTYLDSIESCKLHITVLTAALANSSYIEAEYKTYSTRICNDTWAALNPGYDPYN